MADLQRRLLANAAFLVVTDKQLFFLPPTYLFLFFLTALNLLTFYTLARFDAVFTKLFDKVVRFLLEVASFAKLLT